MLSVTKVPVLRDRQGQMHGVDFAATSAPPPEAETFSEGQARVSSTSQTEALPFVWELALVNNTRAHCVAMELLVMAACVSWLRKNTSLSTAATVHVAMTQPFSSVDDVAGLLSALESSVMN